MLPKLIGISGYSGTGKDVVARYLSEKYDYTRLGFGDALKEEIAQKFPKLLEIEANEMYGHQISSGLCTLAEAIHRLLWEHRTPRTRALLQEYGTAVRRGDNKLYWVVKWSQRYLKIPGRVCSPDVRFSNEIECIRHWGGVLIKVERPGAKPLDHESDLSINQFADSDFDRVFVNGSSFDILLAEIDQWLNDYQSV